MEPDETAQRDAVVEETAVEETTVATAPARQEQKRRVPGPGERATISDYDIVMHYFELACERLGLRDDVREVLGTPYRQISVQIPVHLESGETKVYLGFRVQHN